jgi:outer membrane protein
VAKKLQQARGEVAQRVMREMSARARDVIGELVKTEGIGLLLNAQAAMHADPGYDISAKVTDKLNQTKK